MDLKASESDTTALGDAPPRLMGVHHTAFRCRDAEETRAFYEDVLGLPVKAALAFETTPSSGQKRPFMHLFFELADGKYVAFFDMPDTATPEKFELKDPFDLHYAFEAESHEEMMRFQRRLHAAGVPCYGPIDHHFVQSIYFADPNGLQLEITSREPAHDAIMAEEAGKARQLIADWTKRWGRGAKDNPG
jgi:catechol 2,3-dioxygenase-like lactoylglutathione lyase family enzyme